MTSSERKADLQTSPSNKILRAGVGILGVILVVLIGLLLFSYEERPTTSRERSGTSTADNPVRTAPPSIVRAEFKKLVGRWRRPDGGYILEINDVDVSGKLKAAYYNPSPINVSLAYAAQEDEYTRVYVELRDTGYPGATYSLTYHKEQDAFAGLYHQPTAGQTYQVIFLRQK